ncbi:MAG: PAS domain S-box protein [Sphingorhabdus sp.]
MLVDGITDYAIYMLDTEGRVTNWNTGAQRFKGYKPAEIVGYNFSRFYTEEDRAAGLPARALATAEREGKFESEGWRVRKNGERFWAHVVIDPIRGPSGDLIGFAKITRDLSVRKLAEEALRQTNEQFKLLVQSVTDHAIYMLSPEGIVSSWNAGAQRIKGYAPSEIIGEHFSKFYTSADREKGAPAKALATALEQGQFDSEGWRVRKDGTHFRASVVIDPVYRDDGTLAGFAKITRDVTERDAAQRSLEKAREAAFQSQKVEAIGQFTGGVAHDFNNLLMAILGSLALLRKRMPDDLLNLRLLDNAVEGAQRGATLTQRMLAFARRQDLNPELVMLPDLVRGMTGLLQHSLKKPWVIDTRFPLNVSPVLADANQIEMALLNLVTNARDAMAEGGTITISAKEHMLTEGQAEELPAGKYVSLCVADTGSGMDTETLARATDPFFTTKGVGKGTGLGLSMVHGLAEQSKGKVRIESAPGKGTTVEIWLPAADELPEADSSIDMPPADAPKQESLRILAVDDDRLVLMNTTMLLEDMGHNVFEASAGDTALQIFKEQYDFDLVITDQAMPRMTGLQLADAIREIDPKIPVIIATGYGELSTSLTDVSKLAKPFSEFDLRKAITTALHRDGAS